MLLSSPPHGAVPTPAAARHSNRPSAPAAVCVPHCSFAPRLGPLRLPSPRGDGHTVPHTAARTPHGGTAAAVPAVAADRDAVGGTSAPHRHLTVRLSAPTAGVVSASAAAGSVTEGCLYIWTVFAAAPRRNVHLSVGSYSKKRQPRPAPLSVHFRTFLTLCNGVVVILC